MSKINSKENSYSLNIVITDRILFDKIRVGVWAYFKMDIYNIIVDNMEYGGGDTTAYMIFVQSPHRLSKEKTGKIKSFIDGIVYALGASNVYTIHSTGTFTIGSI